MALTNAQLVTLGNDIRANTNQTVIDALAAGNNQQIADWYNLDASPGYWVFRSLVTSDEIANAIDLQNMVDITAADLDRAMALFDIRAVKGFSGETASDRSAWADVFSTAAGTESRNAIEALWTRLSTNTEKLFSLSTGTGADAANADTTSYQGTVTRQEVNLALELTA